MKYEKLPEATVIIGGWSSSCNNCGKQTINFKVHDKVSGYGSTNEPGCGITFTHMACEYGPQHHGAAKRMAPHLELIEGSLWS